MIHILMYLGTWLPFGNKEKRKLIRALLRENQGLKKQAYEGMSRSQRKEQEQKLKREVMGSLQKQKGRQSGK